MVDKQITQLPVEAAPTRDDAAVLVNDPTGTPEARQITLGTLIDTLLAAIQVTLTPTVDNTYDIGTSIVKWAQAFLGKLVLEEGAAPAAPDAGDVALYAKADGRLYSQDDLGNEALLSGGDPTALGSGRQTVDIQSSYMRPTSTNGCSYLTPVELTPGNPEIDVLRFDGAAVEYAQFSLAFPKKWNRGTITFRVRWTSAHVGTDGVVWGLQAVAAGDSDPIDAAYGARVDVVDAALGVARDFYLSPESAALTIGGPPLEGDEIYFKLSRQVGDASDTMAEDAELLGIEIFYTTTAETDD